MFCYKLSFGASDKRESESGPVLCCQHVAATILRMCNIQRRSESQHPSVYGFRSRVKSGNFGHQVNLDIHLQTVEIQMRRLLIRAVSSGFSLFA